MLHIADLPDTIAIFPLPGALLLPRTRLPLHVFEPRYLAMLDDTLKTRHRLIGMIQPFEAAGSGPTRLHSIGCAGRLTAFSETGDGRCMITLSGISRFRIRQEIDGFTPYRRCRVSWDGFDRDTGTTEHDPDFRRDSFLRLLGRFFKVNALQSDWDALREAEDEMLINALAMLCPFGSEDKQALLEASSLATRRETLVTLIEFSLHRSNGRGGEAIQ